MSNKSKHNKKALLDALEKSLGVVTTACEKVGVSRKTYYEYYNTDEDFKKSVDELSDVAIDFVESKLFDKIDKGDTTASIFYLKTKGKKRGYIEKQEIDHTTQGEKIKDDIDYSKLSEETLRELRNAKK